MIRDYSKGLIYKLCCKDVNIKDIYVGSSINFKQRKKAHKEKCNNINQKAYNNYKYQFIRNNGGFQNWDMIEIKKYPCNEKRQLATEEDKIMRELNATLNTNKPILDKELRNQKKKEYHIKNKVKLNKISNEYYEKNKVKQLSKSNEYYEKNKVIILEKNKQKTYTCDCGSVIRKDGKANHIKTNKHQTFIKQ